MKLTISAAARLYGFHRSTLHRHITSGRLSCDHQPDGSRAVDLSELIRCYGEPPNRQEATRQVATGDATPLQHPDATGDATAATGVNVGSDNQTTALLAELLEVTRQQSRTLEQQREELAALREEVRALRTLPAPGALTPHEQRAPDQTPAPKPPEPESSGKPRPEAPGSGLSFGDLLARMESRQRH